MINFIDKSYQIIPDWNQWKNLVREVEKVYNASWTKESGAGELFSPPAFLPFYIFKEENIMSYVDEVIAQVIEKNPAQPEFHQAVKEVLESLRVVIEAN